MGLQENILKHSLKHLKYRLHIITLHIHREHWSVFFSNNNTVNRFKVCWLAVHRTPPPTIPRRQFPPHVRFSPPGIPLTLPGLCPMSVADYHRLLVSSAGVRLCVNQDGTHYNRYSLTKFLGLYVVSRSRKCLLIRGFTCMH